MICPHCNREIPTPSLKQMEAYRLVHILGLPQAEAAEVLGVNQSSISRRLSVLSEMRPDLFKLPVKRMQSNNTVTFDELRDYKISRQF